MPPNCDDSQHSTPRPDSGRSARHAIDPAVGLFALLVGAALPLALPWPSAGFGLALGVLALCLIRRAWSGRWAALTAGFLVSGVAGHSWQLSQLPATCERISAQLSGVIVDFPSFETLAGETRQQFDLRLDEMHPKSCSGPGVVRVSYWRDQPIVHLGQRIDAEVTLLPAHSQWNPGLLPDQLAAVAASRYARASALNLTVTGDARAWGASVRNQLAEAIAAQPATTRARGLLSALVVGRGNAISRSDWARFQRLGLSHVLVISGLHIGLVFGLVWLLSNRMITLGSIIGRGMGAVLGLRFQCLPCAGHGAYSRMLSLMTALLAASGYALLAGFAIPTQRALIMLVCLAVARLLGWVTAPWRVLLLAVTGVVLLDPFAILGRSLWMSASATGVLILLSGPLRQRMLTSHPPRAVKPGLGGVVQRGLSVFLSGFRTALLVQLGLVILMAPVTLFWFGKLSLAAVVCNLLLVPPIGLWVVPLALLGALGELCVDGLGGVPWELALRALEVLIPLMDRLDLYLADLSTVSASLSWSGSALALPLSAGAFWPALGVLFAGTAMPALAPWLATQYKAVSLAASLTILDVGQGLAVLWQEGDRVLLYDTGAGVPEGFSQAAKAVIPYLKSQGLEKLDTLVVSHADIDHSGGLAHIQQHLPVLNHWGYRGQRCRPGARLPWSGNAHLTLHNGPTDPAASDNAGSCVLMIEYLGRRFLLAGDIPVRRERELVRYWRKGLSADVLVVGHHGSQTSTAWSFLKWVQPQWAVISAGRANRFGHPATLVTQRLDQLSISRMNTANRGAVVFELHTSGAIVPRNQRSGIFPYWLRLP